MVGKGYGMPSSHAQFVAYFSTFLTLFLLLRHSPHGNIHVSTTHLPTPLWQRAILASLLLAGAAAVAQSRIYLSYHTPRQVLVGSAIGVGCAVAWFIVTSIARRHGFIDILLDLPPLKWLRLRDLVVNETLEDAGWERWQRSRERRAQQSVKKDT
jgi:dolichyldiphosphatase